MTRQAQIDADNLVTMGCLMRAAARLMLERELSQEQTCRLMGAFLRRTAGEHGMELPGELYRDLLNMAQLPIAPATFAALLKCEGDKATAEALVLIQRETE